LTAPRREWSWLMLLREPSLLDNLVKIYPRTSSTMLAAMSMSTWEGIRLRLTSRGPRLEPVHRCVPIMQPTPFLPGVLDSFFLPPCFLSHSVCLYMREL
jgi:hypothetical protein